MEKEKKQEINHAKIIGDILANELEKKEISQTKLADMTQIPKTTISSYIRGISMPSVDNLGKICTALDVSMDTFNTNNTENAKISLEKQHLELQRYTFNRLKKWIETSGVYFDRPPLTESQREEGFTYNHISMEEGKYLHENDEMLYELRYENLVDAESIEFVIELDKEISKKIVEFLKKKSIRTIHVEEYISTYLD